MTGNGHGTCPTASAFRSTTDVVVRFPQQPGSHRAIIFCHGVGEHHDHYEALTSAWAALGFVVFLPRFADAWTEVAQAQPELGLDPTERSLRWLSDDPRARSVFREHLYDPRYWTSRLRDVQGVLDALASLARQAAVPGGIDDTVVAIAGHSFGAFTAQMALGVEVEGIASSERFCDPRVRCGLLLSPQGPGERGLTERSWDAMISPTMVITATKDSDAAGHGLAWRREPYDRAPGGERYLVVVDDADHGLGGIAGPSRGFFRDDPQARDAVTYWSGRFFQATLGDSSTAHEELLAAAARAGRCVLEHR